MRVGSCPEISFFACYIEVICRIANSLQITLFTAANNNNNNNAEVSQSSRMRGYFQPSLTIVAKGQSWLNIDTIISQLNSAAKQFPATIVALPYS